MALTTQQIVTILQLPRLKRQTAFEIYHMGKDIEFRDDNDIIELVEKYNSIAKSRNSRVYSYNDVAKAFIKTRKIIEKSDQNGIKLISYYDDDFPLELRSMRDKPIMLSARGNFKEINNLVGIAIVGSRIPTKEGEEFAEYLGKYFGEKGYNIVSGLAAGCDTAAHRGCLKGKGFTVALLPHGLHMTYPRKNRQLAEEIVDNGGVLLSEYTFGTGVSGRYFTERDRLQAGLSKATIAIQFEDGGSTIHAINGTIEGDKSLAVVDFNNLDTQVVTGNKRLLTEGKAFALTRNNVEEFEKTIQ